MNLCFIAAISLALAQFALGIDPMFISVNDETSLSYHDTNTSVSLTGSRHKDGSFIMCGSYTAQTGSTATGNGAGNMRSVVVEGRVDRRGRVEGYADDGDKSYDVKGRFVVDQMSESASSTQTSGNVKLDLFEPSGRSNGPRVCGTYTYSFTRGSGAAPSGYGSGKMPDTESITANYYGNVGGQSWTASYSQTSSGSYSQSTPTSYISSTSSTGSSTSGCFYKMDINDKKNTFKAKGQLSGAELAISGHFKSGMFVSDRINLASEGTGLSGSYSVYYPTGGNQYGNTDSGNAEIGSVYLYSGGGMDYYSMAIYEDGTLSSMNGDTTQNLKGKYSDSKWTAKGSKGIRKVKLSGKHGMGCVFATKYNVRCGGSNDMKKALNSTMQYSSSGMVGCGTFKDSGGFNGRGFAANGTDVHSWTVAGAVTVNTTATATGGIPDVQVDRFLMTVDDQAVSANITFTSLDLRYGYMGGTVDLKDGTSMPFWGNIIQNTWAIDPMGGAAGKR